MAKIDFSTVLTDLKGKPLLRPNGSGEPDQVTLAMIASEALLNSYEEDKNVSGDVKARRFRLALKVDAGGEIDLKSEEVTEIKKIVGKAWSPLIVGRAYDILDPPSDGS